MFFNFKIIFHITGEWHVSTNMVIIRCFENCCTSINEYNSKAYPRLCAHVLLYVCSAWWFLLRVECSCYLHMTCKRNHPALQMYWTMFSTWMAQELTLLAQYPPLLHPPSPKHPYRDSFTIIPSFHVPRDFPFPPLFRKDRPLSVWVVIWGQSLITKSGELGC
jgi:hypothetical protein